MKPWRDLVARLDGLDRAFLVIALTALVLSAAALPFLPPEVPIHFGRDLKPDRFMAKPLGALVVLAFGVAFYVAARPVAWLMGHSLLSPLAVVLRIFNFMIGTLLAVLNVLICGWTLVDG